VRHWMKGKGNATGIFGIKEDIDIEWYYDFPR
jgi:hypothetical protein